MITKRVESFTIPVAAKPTGLTLDPAEKIMLKTIKITPLLVQ
jgi:hypothetical protein